MAFRDRSANGSTLEGSVSATLSHKSKSVGSREDIGKAYHEKKRLYTLVIQRCLLCPGS